MQTGLTKSVSDTAGIAHRSARKTLSSIRNTLGFNFGTGQPSLPEIDFGGVYDNLGATGYSIPRGRTSQSFQILDNFTWMRGRHTVKFGGEYRRISVDSFDNNLSRGQLEFGSSTFGVPGQRNLLPTSGQR